MRSAWRCRGSGRAHKATPETMGRVAVDTEAYAMIPYVDLLGTPWINYGDHDCVWLAKELLRRGGFTPPEPIYDAEWQEVAEAVRDGDIVVTSWPNGDHHLSTLVSRGLIVTTSQKHGVHALRLDQLRNVVGVYRLP